MIRDISPTQWNAPGTAQVSLNILLSSIGFGPLPLDIWLSNYSPGPDFNPLTNLPSGFTTLNSPDTVNTRFFLVVLPRGNTQSVTLKGTVGDSGISVNANGFALVALAPGVTSVGLLCGGIVNGAFVAFF